MIIRNFNPFPHLCTERLILRQLRDEDETEIFAIRSNQEMAKYLDRPLCENKAQAKEFINKINNGIENNEWIYWGISLKENPTLIGTICLWNILSEQSKADIGFELLPNYQGKRLMQEAVKVVIDYGFNKMNLEIINGEVDPSNIKSIKLMEKFGFTVPEGFTDSNAKTIVYKLYK